MCGCFFFLCTCVCVCAVSFSFVTISLDLIHFNGFIWMTWVDDGEKVFSVKKTCYFRFVEYSLLKFKICTSRMQSIIKFYDIISFYIYCSFIHLFKITLKLLQCTYIFKFPGVKILFCPTLSSIFLLQMNNIFLYIFTRFILFIFFWRILYSLYLDHNHKAGCIYVMSLPHLGPTTGVVLVWFPLALIWYQCYFSFHSNLYHIFGNFSSIECSFKIDKPITTA